MMVLIYKSIFLFLLDPEMCATNWCKFLCFHSLKLGGQLNLEGNIGQPKIWYNSNVFDVAWSKLETESFVQKCQDERDWQKSQNHFYFYFSLLYHGRLGTLGVPRWMCCFTRRQFPDWQFSRSANPVPTLTDPKVSASLTHTRGRKNGGIRKYWKNKTHTRG